MATLRDIPLFTALSASRRILVAGAGGGFDIYGGLPLGTWRRWRRRRR